jgi:hypothetical protein
MTVTMTSAGLGITSAVTDASGVSIQRRAGRPFTLLTQNRAGLQGTGSGQVTADNATVTVNITLIANVAALPRTFVDANGMQFDLQSNGSVNDGSNDAYDGGLNLRLFNAAGTSNSSWTGAATGLLEDGGREIELQPQVATTFGLQIKRKVFVPADGYLARYLEVLTNPTGSPITVGVQVEDFLGSDSATIAISTSSGDTNFLIDDQWIVTDDDNDRRRIELGSDAGARLRHRRRRPVCLPSASRISSATAGA